MHVILFYFAADNGFNPFWNETTDFRIQNPALTFIRFVVNDEDMFGDANFIGQNTYPVCYFVYLLLKLI
jgi:Ca2+-dependent lipid-binding protein